MLRRTFLGLLSGLFCCGVTPAKPQELRPIWRKTSKDTFHRVRMQHLQVGDIMVFDNTKSQQYKITGKPKMLPNGVWSVEAEAIS